MIITRIYGFKLKISTDYTGLGKIQYLLAQKDIPVLGTDYTESVEITALVSQEEEKQITAEIIEGTNGKSQIQKQKECWFAAVEGEVVVFD